MRSGSGMCAVYRLAVMVSSVISSGASSPFFTCSAMARTAFFDLVTATVIDAQRGCCRVRTKPIGNLVHLRDLRADILRQNGQIA